MPDDEWQYELDLNLNHTFWATRRALRHMIPRGWGRIIAMSLDRGQARQTQRRRLHRQQARRQRLRQSRSPARSAATASPSTRSVPASCSPTWSRRRPANRSDWAASIELVELYTAETALGRCVTVDEIAAFCVHLASDQGAGFSGANISLDGGTAFF